METHCTPRRTTDRAWLLREAGACLCRQRWPRGQESTEKPVVELSQGSTSAAKHSWGMNPGLPRRNISPGHCFVGHHEQPAAAALIHTGPETRCTPGARPWSSSSCSNASNGISRTSHENEHEADAFGCGGAGLRHRNSATLTFVLLSLWCLTTVPRSTRSSARPPRRAAQAEFVPLLRALLQGPRRQDGTGRVGYRDFAR